MRLLCLSLLTLALACGDDDGGTDSGTDTGVRDTGSSDSATDTGSDAPADASTDVSADTAEVCATAAEDAPCTVEGTFCGGPCTDMCSFCNLFECRDGTWGRVEVFPAPCFDCGPDLRCVSGDRYCSVFLPGVPDAEPTYECVMPPEACEGTDLGCTCLAGAGVVGDCREGDPGEVTVTLAAP